MSNINTINKEMALKLMNEVWMKGNLDVVDELIAPQYVIKNDPGDAFERMSLNLTVFKQRISYTRSAFPDLQFDIKDVLCEGDRVAISWLMSGTQKGDLPNLPATNRKVNFSGITIYYISGGKITGHWQVFDRLLMLSQLGVSIGRNKNWSGRFWFAG